MKYKILDGYKYELMDAVKVQTGILDCLAKIDNYVLLNLDGSLLIGAYYAWDGASGVPDSKSVMRASLVHDALCQLMRVGLLDRDKYRIIAADIFRKMSIEDGLSGFWAWVYWKGLCAVKSYTFPEKKPRGKVVEI